MLMVFTQRGKPISGIELMTKWLARRRNYRVVLFSTSLLCLKTGKAGPVSWFGLDLIELHCLQADALTSILPVPRGPLLWTSSAVATALPDNEHLVLIFFLILISVLSG